MSTEIPQVSPGAQRPDLEKMAYPWCRRRRAAGESINYNGLAVYLRPLVKDITLDELISFARTFTNFFFVQESVERRIIARRARATSPEKVRESLLHAATRGFIAKRKEHGYGVTAPMLAMHLCRKFPKLQHEKSLKFVKDFLTTEGDSN